MVKDELVVPYIGTWIETNLKKQGYTVTIVVPYIGTWIETDFPLTWRIWLLSYLI